MAALADIKASLPDWPDDVIDQWLIYFANEPEMGWPPLDPFVDHRWGKILGGRPISWWREVTWKLENTKCNPAVLCPKARADITAIINAANGKKLDLISQRRFDHAFHYILNNAAFPRPPITMQIPGGLSLLDGAHRMAAFCALQQMPAERFEKLNLQKASEEQEVWLGTHTRGEVPLG